MTKLPFDADAIRLLAGLLIETGLTEIEVAEKDGRIRVVRQPAQVAPPGGPPPVAAAERALEEESLDVAAHPGVIKSPMVGIVYLAAEPGAPPFVTPGQTVSAGQTLLLVEAMKTFNQIKAPRAGKITRVLVRSGTPVEYDEPLMILE